jgi:DNA-binding response OmpR family regulator
MPTRGPQTILLVDDSFRVRTLIRKVLDEHGYRVLEAEKAQIAQGLLLENDCRVDLMITDLMLPGSNGIDLARKARQLCPDLKVLYMSGYDIDPQSSLDFIEKPFQPDELIFRIRSLLT